MRQAPIMSCYHSDEVCWVLRDSVTYVFMANTAAKLFQCQLVVYNVGLEAARRFQVESVFGTGTCM